MTDRGLDQPYDIDELWPDEAELGAILRSHFRRQPDPAVMARHLAELRMESAALRPDDRPGPTVPMIMAAACLLVALVAGGLLLDRSETARLDTVGDGRVVSVDSTASTSIPTTTPTTTPSTTPTRPSTSTSASSTTVVPSTANPSSSLPSAPTSTAPSRPPSTQAPATQPTVAVPAQPPAVGPPTSAVESTDQAGPPGTGDGADEAGVDVGQAGADDGSTGQTTVPAETTSTTWDTTTLETTTEPPPASTTTVPPAQPEPECREVGLLFRRTVCDGDSGGGLLSGLFWWLL